MKKIKTLAVSLLLTGVVVATVVIIYNIGETKSNQARANNDRHTRIVRLSNQFADNDLEELRNKVDDLESNVDDLKSKNDDLENEIDSLKSKNADLESEIGSLKSANDDLESEIHRLKSRNNDLESKIDDLEMQISHLKFSLSYR